MYDQVKLKRGPINNKPSLASFIEVLTISLSLLCHPANLPISSTNANTHIKHSAFSILNLFFEGIRTELLITLLFEKWKVLMAAEVSKLVFLSCCGGLICV